MTHANLRSEICRIGQSLYARGYVHASAGNISVKLPGGGFLITPTDACLGDLQPEALAHVDESGTQISGDRASKTLRLHQHIYAAEPAATCVIHTHASHLVQLSIQGVWSAQDIVPPITPYFVMKVGHVPQIPYAVPGALTVAAQVAAVIQRSQRDEKSIRAVLLERLGPVVWHASPAQASAVLEELEETAKLWLATNCRATPLSDEAIQDLRDAFGARW
jgi:ribulose-5-phosphate 4-epimerase/fuculose-1-phosphate aldolase